MTDTRVRIGRLRHEALLALVVLALAFLNFGHTSAVFAAGGRVVVTAHAICGDPGAIPAAGDHFACHGCRPDLALLPPAPASCDPIAFAEARAIYADLPTITFVTHLVALPPARGPPQAG